MAYADRLRWVSVIGALVAIGCGGDAAGSVADVSLAPDGGLASDAAAVEDDAATIDPTCEVTPTYEELRDTIFTPRCTTGRCHGGTDGPLPQRGPSNFTETSTRLAMVDRASVWMMGLVLVRPGDPEGSFLMAKLTNDLPADPRIRGVAMPPSIDGAPREPLSESEIASIRCWIAGGAP